MPSYPDAGRVGSAKHPVAVSSLICLFHGDDDCDPVHEPGLVKAILDGMADDTGGRFMGSVYSLAERLFPGLADIAPRVPQRYAEITGEPAWTALVAGMALWRESLPK